MKLPIVAVCLFGNAEQWEVDCWLRAWKRSGNRNRVVALSIKEKPFSCKWPHPVVYAKYEELPKSDKGGMRGLSDCIKAQAFDVLHKPCIVMDVDCMVIGKLKEIYSKDTPIAMSREYQSGLRKWKPYAMELNAGVCFQNDSRIWSLFKRLWLDGLKTNEGGGCYGQYVFGRVVKRLKGKTLHRKYNYMEHCAPFKYKPKIPKNTVIAHFHSDGEQFLKDIYHGSKDWNLNQIGVQPFKLMLCAPCYYQQTGFNFLSSILSEVPKICEHGITVEIQFSIGDAVQKQRNNLCTRFLKSQNEALLFIDSDMGFRADDIVRMVRSNKPVIGVNYPTRRLRWEAVYGKDIERVKNSALVGITVGYQNEETLRLAEAIETDKCSITQPVKVAYIGGGCMLIRRNVFRRLVNRKMCPPSKDGGFQFFQFTPQPGGEQRGEDYSFCDLTRKVGYNVWLDPQARCSHLGMYMFEGTPQLVGAIKE